jgi:hypothetical protein
MTVQEPEIIFLEGKPLDLYAPPLDPYLQHAKWRPTFRWRSTAQLRGYTGRWQVFGTRLFLTGLLGMGWMAPPNEIKKLSPNPKLLENMRAIELKDIFPDQAPLVFAGWVTRRLVVATGPEVEGIHAGYNVPHASHLTLDVKKGHIQAISAWVNGQEARQIPPNGLAEEFRKNPPQLLKWPNEWLERNYFASLDDYERAQEHALRKPCGQVPND